MAASCVADSGLLTEIRAILDAAEPRDSISRLRALLVLSMVMTECEDERQILQMALATAPSLGVCRAEGVFLDGTWRSAKDGLTTTPESIKGLVVQLEELPGIGGPVVVRSEPWCWAYPLRSRGAVTGFLVASSSTEPTGTERFLLRSLAQQTAVALANARLHVRERSAAEDLGVANLALQSSLQALQRGTEIHHRLSRVATSGEGLAGIAKALHELTGYSVAIEDRYGNLRAWAGSPGPEPYPKDPPARREQLLRQALRHDGPFREGDRLLAVVRPREDVIGVIALVDPAATVGEQELVALEHGSTVLAMELARLQSLAETELRLGRDLVEELLAGADEQSALGRANALGYDLERPHRVVVVEGRCRTTDDNLFFHAVRRGARDCGVGTLLVARAGAVVVLSDCDQRWEKFRSSVLQEVGPGGRCRIGVGGQCERPSDFPRSYREAQLAIRMQKTSLGRDSITVFDQLGVYRLLADVNDPSIVERLIRQWLGPLLEYDLRRGSELVNTLAQYLECGGNYDATAEALCVHRSTLKYRLQRIRELGQYDLHHPDTHFNLQLACRAWRTLQALGQDGDPPDNDRVTSA